MHVETAKCSDGADGIVGRNQSVTAPAADAHGQAAAEPLYGELRFVIATVVAGDDRER
jgi:hypothetical protein